jgi:hypothetical protein
MDTTAEFRKHAINCNRMAKVSNDPETKGICRRMAQRWASVRQTGRRRRAISSAASRAKELADAHRLTTVGVCGSFANCARIL